MAFFKIKNLVFFFKVSKNFEFFASSCFFSGCPNYCCLRSVCVCLPSRFFFRRCCVVLCGVCVVVVLWCVFCNWLFVSVLDDPEDKGKGGGIYCSL